MISDHWIYIRISMWTNSNSQLCAIRRLLTSTYERSLQLHSGKTWFPITLVLHFAESTGIFNEQQFRTHSSICYMQNTPIASYKYCFSRNRMYSGRKEILIEDFWANFSDQSVYFSCFSTGKGWVFKTSSNFYGSFHRRLFILQSSTETYNCRLKVPEILIFF